jgi:DNA processing protein
MDRLYWIALSMVPGIGPVLFKRLLARFDTPEKVFKMPASLLREVEGIGEKLASEIKSFRDWKRAEGEIERAAAYGAAIVTMADEGYSKNLLNIYDPPPYLYVKGLLDGEERSIAIVGSRFASTYGRIVTEGLSRDLAKSGFTVVSGMARGIDTSAHKGAMEAGGRTVAVLGSGIDVIYPPENKGLYEEICDHGAVISEFPMGTEPLGENFPSRNRIISGISKGVVIVEASLKSGSLITASLAAEQGREVFAVPGNVNSKGSKGTNRLIKEGARLVEDVGDILEELDGPSNPRCNVPLQIDLTKEEASLMGLLTEPLHIDDISSLSGMDTRTVSAMLLNLELSGIVRQLPGMVYVRNI